MDTIAEKYKARLVAEGFQQKEGVDLNEALASWRSYHKSVYYWGTPTHAIYM